MKQVAEVRAVAFAAGLLIGVGTFVFVGIFMGLDYFSARGAPTEHAVVVSMEPSGTQPRSTDGLEVLSAA